MPATTATPRETAERFLRAAIGADPGDMADCYAPSFVIEMPFAVAPLFPGRVENTREELRARLRAGAASRRYKRLGNVVMHETADPEVVIVEYELHGEFTETAEPFSMRFLMILTVRDGQIVHSRDYSNPIVGARVTGRLPELIAALNADGAAISS
ncbi:MAG TPA: nuclear transport factor 2 family protein [Streptosporangiaceae bacterium]|nr:nuclear transport factor 2 family protein [Streptosporangiaceae bacterium]